MGTFRKKIEGLSPDDKRALIAKILHKKAGHQTGSFPRGSSIHALFEAQAGRAPGSVALACGPETMTFEQLNQRANQLAHLLRSQGVGPESLVGICLDRSFNMVVAILATLKSGAAYVPIESFYPADRITYILDDAGISTLLTERNLIGSLPPSGCDVICLDSDAETISTQSSDDPTGEVISDSAAYVIYTSGSTGRPKGVVVTHANVVRLLEMTQHWFNFNSDDVWTLFHSYAFDFSVWELWGALLFGGRLVIVPYWVSRSPDAFYELLVKEGVTVLNQTPSAFRQLVAAERSCADGRELKLRLVIFGGEALKVQSLGEWFSRHPQSPQLVNMYGITETTVHVTYRPISISDVTGGCGSVIGEPIPDLQIHILDQHLKPVPVGVAGEIYVAGQGLSRGYLNRPGLTADRFIPNPFSREPGGRLYRTGDLARSLSNGDIEYLGRIDQQVKIRGHRIELGEVEAVLGTHPGVKDVVVLDHEDDSDEKQLLAYVVMDLERNCSADELRSFMKEKVPEYMVPSLFLTLDALPLTPNGKLDRKALLESGQIAPVPEVDYVAPRTALEGSLAEIWAEVLGVERVGIDDNFFTRGGDSIRCVRVVGLAKQADMSLAVQDMFIHQTIRELAAEIEGRASVAGRRAEPLCLISDSDRSRLPQGVQDAYPLTMLQAGMIFHIEQSPGSSLYHILDICQLKAPYDLDALRASLQSIILRHDILRTSFDLTSFSEPLQLVHSATALSLEAEDLRDLSPDEQRQALDEWAEAEKTRRFDITRAPLVRFTVHRLADDVSQFTVTQHHAALDGWSVTSLVNEIFHGYFSALQHSPLPDQKAPAISFRDFVALERTALESEECRRYWTGQLHESAFTTIPRWSSDRRQAEQSGFRIQLPSEMSQALRGMAVSAGVPLKSVLLAAHMRVMSLVSGQTDILSGLVVDGRPEELDGDRLLGLFLNSVPFRLILSGGTWTELAERTFEAERELLPFRRYPLAQIQRLNDGKPLFETLFTFTNFHVLKDVFESSNVEVLGMSAFARDNFTLAATFDIEPMLEENIRFTLSYDGSEISPEQAHAIQRYYVTTLARMAQSPSSRFESYPPLPEEELRQIERWNETGTAYPESSCVHELFEAQVNRTPNAPAVVGEGRQLSYAELNRRANQLARYLRRLGVGPEALVAIYMSRSPEMIVALLGVLKAGAAYLPLDPTYPQSRIEFMLDDADAAALLTQERLSDGLPMGAKQVICLDSMWELIARESEENLDREATPDNLAYVIYTSGSTGRPKAVMIGQRSLLAYTLNASLEFAVSPRDRILQFASICFDASAEEIYPCLINGATLVLRDEAMMGSVTEFLDRCNAWGITILGIPTGLWHEIADQVIEQTVDLPPSMRLVVIGTERVLPERLAAWHRVVGARVQLLNGYGPTEATVVATMCELSGPSISDIGSGEASIGYPIRNAQVYILDEFQQPAPIGTPGQLHIGGIGLARGYLNRPDLTSEKFIPNMLSRVAGERLYKTGDLARYMPDGKVEFLGRIDHQVKIRGFRVELGEIESRLVEHPAVQAAVVVAVEPEPGQKRLVAYIVARPQNGDDLLAGEGESESPSKSQIWPDLRAYLKDRLPNYMVPSAFVLLDALPLTSSGKIDRKRLPEPDVWQSPGEKTYVGPRTVVEEVLAGIWAHALNTERVSVHDDFFELGGHSLLAIRILSQARQALQIELPLSSIFEVPTVAGLAGRIEDEIKAGKLSQALPIQITQRDSELPLSFAQQRMWFLNQLEPDSPAYNMPAAIRLEGDLDIFALENVLNEITRRHEVLRTTFATTDGRPVQVIAETKSTDLPVINLSELCEEEKESEAKRLVGSEARRPFNLEHGPLLRTSVLVLGERETIVLFTMHHIISDAWSTDILVREVSALYEAYLDNRPSPLPELAIQYADYAQWQRDWLQGEVLEGQLLYWRQQLGGTLPVLELPADRPRPAVPSLRGGRQEISISREAVERIRAISHSQGGTLFMGLLAAFKAVMYRYSGQQDIVVGTPVAGRSRQELEPLIGFFVNTVAVRTQVEGDISYKELVGRVRESAIGAYMNQDLPFEKLIEELQPERDLSRQPLFQVAFLLEDASQELPQLRGLAIKPMLSHNETAKFDLTLTVIEATETSKAIIEYNTDLFNPETIERMCRHYERVVESAGARAGEAKVSELEMMSQEEQRQVVEEWNQTHREYEAGVSIKVMIERQAQERGEEVAVESGGERVSYRQLNEKANQVGNYLRKRGVGEEHVVGVYMERGVGMVVGLVGVMKAGGAYLPLDPAYPKARIAYMVKDSGVRVVLTQRHLAEDIIEAGAEPLCIDSLSNEIEQESGDNFPNQVSGDNLAYIIYTSGSTGRPKGAQLTYAGFTNLVMWYIDVFKPTPEDRLSHVAASGFDASVFEIWPALVAGASLYVAGADVRTSPSELKDWILSNRITVSFIPTLFAEGLIASDWTTDTALRILHAGGDKLRSFPPAGLPFEVTNNYGPTETTVVASCGIIKASHESTAVPTIGRPITNMQIYILDHDFNPVPIGVSGELHIGGIGLGRGYLNQPGLTAEKFIPNPFAAEPGARLYKTGDLARYLADGNIECLGRIDHQVKIRSNRVELEEIESLLNDYPSVGQSLVLAQEDGADAKRLVAYITLNRQPGSAQDSEPSINSGQLIDSVRSMLREKLPDYMIPSGFIILDEFPITENGKVDRSILLRLEQVSNEAREGYVAADNPIEEVLAGIWADVLAVKLVGRNENFFDIGGHSLSAAQVMSRIRTVFNIELPLRSIFINPTVASLAQEITRTIQQGVGQVQTSIERVRREGGVRLSFAQQRLWVLHQLDPQSSAYNIPSAYQIVGHLDIEALRGLMGEIVGRHEPLRTRFIEADDGPLQIIDQPGPVELPEVDLTQIEGQAGRDEALRICWQQARQPFNLSQGELMRVWLIKEEEQRHVLMVNMHHIISDGWSSGVMIREVAALYGAYVKGEPSGLRELEVQYADYAEWQRGRLERGEMDHQREYWARQLEGAAAVIELPYDRPRPAAPSLRGGRQEINISREAVEQIRAISHSQGGTLFMGLLAAFKAVMYRYSGQQDIVVGTPVAGRSRQELEPLIGFFVNTVAIRTQVEGDISYKELVGRVRESAIGAYMNEELPFEEVVRQQGASRVAGQSPIFEVMFILQNAPRQGAELEGLSIRGIEMDNGESKYSVVMNLTEWEGGVRGWVGYQEEVFEAETIARMSRHYERMVEAAGARGGEAKVSELEMMSQEEQRQVVEEWNQTHREYEAGASIKVMIERQAEKRGEEVAVESGGERVSYRQLNEKANKVGNYLRRRGVRQDEIVGVYMERGLGMVVGLVGVMKAGGAYLPLDPAYPKARIAYMVKDSGVRVVLTQGHLAEDIIEAGAEPLCIDSLSNEIDLCSQENPDIDINPESSAYVIYTSGSTGHPKGVVVEHRQILNYIFGAIEILGLTPGVHYAMVQPFTVDSCKTVVLPSILTGGCLHIISSDRIADGAALAEYFAAQQIDCLKIAPSHLAALHGTAAPESIMPRRWLVIGGEAPREEWALGLKALKPSCQIHNHYGPTETTVAMMTYQVEEKPCDNHSRLLPIGRPIPNTKAYVLDSNMRPVPIGVHGELYIGGECVARGYAARPDSTAERFIPDPFSREAGKRLYRTGDLVRYMPDGNVEFIGRIDNQVKIYGHRVEPGEIEAVLLSHPTVKEAVVQPLQAESGQSYLVAYVVPKSEMPPDVPELRQLMKERLPRHMVPSSIMFLDELPRTPQGKLARKNLPVPDQARSDEASFVAPRTPIEEELCEIWRGLLKIDRVGIHDNFFDLGGDSLLLTQLAARIRTSFKIEVPMRTLFDKPSVFELTMVIGERQAQQVDAAELAEMLQELKQLSSDEINQLLKNETT